MSIQALTDLRRAKGLTQADLARLAGISPGALGKIEQGKHRARPSTRRRICKALRVAYVKHEQLFGPLAKPGKVRREKANDR